MKLVLFDIDDTLIKVPKVSIRAFSEAFRKVYGIDTTIEVIRYQGMTDQLILIEVLKKNGLDEQEIKLKMKDATKAMIEFFKKEIDNSEIIVLKGVQELLKELDKNNILMGLVTGNLEEIAREKLKKVGLNHYFKVGGFGSDDMYRTNLVRLAVKKAEENFNFKFNNNVFLFGDAPQDIKAGKEAGIKTVGVATGIYLKEQLKEAGADFLIEDLKDKDEILRIISL